MAKKAKAIPEGMHTVTPYLTVKGASAAIEFYQKAFGFEEVMRMPGPNGLLMHAEIKLGDSMVMLSDEMPDMGGKSPTTLGGSTGSLHIYTEDVDAAFQRAVAAGATVQMPPMDMFWGDRYCKVGDPFGHTWGLATHKEDLTPEEMGQRQQAWMEQMAKQGQK
jgi:PhnB protein